MPTLNLSNTTPAAPSGKQNLVWAINNSSDPANASAVDPVFTGDAGSGGLAGNVPAPAAGDAAHFLRGDATWATPPVPASPTFADWSPTYAGFSGMAVSLSTHYSSRYSQVGKICTIYLWVALTLAGTPSNAIIIGAPVTPRSTRMTLAGIVRLGSTAQYIPATAWIGDGGNPIYILTPDGSNFPSGYVEVQVGGSYETT